MAKCLLKVGRILRVQSSTQDEGRNRTYVISGQVFFASAETFVNSFDFKEEIDEVTIDISHAHFWDITAVGALDKVILKFKRNQTKVNLLGMNEATKTMVDKFGLHDKMSPGSELPAH